MKKWFSSKESKKITSIILILCVTLIVQIMGFSNFNQKVYDMSLEHSIEQAEELSVFVEKNLQLEINRYIHILQVIASQLSESERLFSSNMIEQLKQVDPIAGFKMMGIADLDGKGIASTGKTYNIFYDHMREHIENGKVYISNVLKHEKETLIFIAVPLKIRNETCGILWGKYALADIMANLDFPDTSHKYFQIIDDKGNYLLSSNHEFVLNKISENSEETIWDELKSYQYSDGMSPERLYEAIHNRESGNFYLKDNGQGRYISYRPLNINNWYLFSVQSEDGLHAYVHHTHEIAAHLFTLLTIGLLTIFGIIYNLIYTMYKRLVKQNSEIQSINAMFRTTLQQTKNIPFAIDKKLKQLIFYGYPTKDVIQCCSFSDMNPDNMLKKGLLDPGSLGEYNKLYQSVIIQQEKCDPVIIYSRVGTKKEWIRVRITDADDNADQMIGVLEDYGEQREKEIQIENHLDDIKKIEEKSQFDFLTKLYNRETFLEKMQAALAENHTNHQTGALLILDLDHFKEVNDCMGHGMGDLVLQKTANTLRNFFRRDDIVGRLGGDEFVVFAQNIRNTAAFEKRIKELNHLLCKVYHKEGKSVEVSASIGIALTSADLLTFHVLYEKADEALYQVKQTSRNGYQFYSDPK